MVQGETEKRKNQAYEVQVFYLAKPTAVCEAGGDFSARFASNSRQILNIEVQFKTAVGE